MNLARLNGKNNAGIGRWTDGEIKLAVTGGISADGSPLLPPMGFAYYARMTEPDLDALVAYLRTLPPSPSEGDQ